MGNLIISNDFITVANAAVTIRSALSGYDKINIMDYWHLGRTSRADDLTKSDSNPLYRIDLSSAQTVAGIFLNHVNYDKVRIRGHASDLGTNWAASTFDSGSDHAVSQNSLNGRYQIFLPLTSFNYRWLAVMTPAAASAVGDYTTKWETSSIAILDSYTTLSKNMAYGYKRSVTKAHGDTDLKSLARGRVSLSDYFQVQLDCNFNVRKESDESELWTLNRLVHEKPIVIYENQGDDENAYLVVRDSDYASTWLADNLVRGAFITFSELV